MDLSNKFPQITYDQNRFDCKKFTTYLSTVNPDIFDSKRQIVKLGKTLGKHLTVVNHMKGQKVGKKYTKSKQNFSFYDPLTL